MREMDSDATTDTRPTPRPGGRSARVQRAVHDAVNALLGEIDRAQITVPAIAARAGVTPSTIYRRWGDLGELLADVAVERLRPDTPPEDTGSAQRDVLLYVTQFADEMASGPGRTVLRDVIGSTAENRSGTCCNVTRNQLELIGERAAARGEDFPGVEYLIDTVIAPIIFRILSNEPPGEARVAALVAHAFGTMPDPSRTAPALSAPSS
ncbi:TetR/AcrR family transcriptional regulator [Acuticoccus sediminis]|uniref:TetR/AcrR family transcriptional regulator n=1 Tax=Acuticoccus sediminis TaxID=2184697 RepID=UPI001CFD9C44|nr:TetR/AcrR family transcriptional regulator [Acuticoccus sediminis]